MDFSRRMYQSTSLRVGSPRRALFVGCSASSSTGTPRDGTGWALGPNPCRPSSFQSPRRLHNLLIGPSSSIPPSQGSTPRTGFCERTYPSPYGSQKNSVRPSAKSQLLDEALIAGSEGWGRVASSNGSRLKEGSLVAIGRPGLGTLRSSLWAEESSFLQLPEKIWEISGPAGSTLTQLGGTALRMLSDFVVLQPGDVVVQNAGNSGVGLMVSQIATELFGVSVVSLVRRGSKNQEEFNDLVIHLEEFGKAALVVAEEDLKDKQAWKKFKSDIKELSGSGHDLPKLALNTVGGESVKQLIRSVAKHGTVVTYGGMSGEPVVVGTPQLIFKDVQLRGYWQSRWMVQQSHDKKQEMVDTLVKLVLDGAVTCPPVNVFPIHAVQEALHWVTTDRGGIRKKLIWDCADQRRAD
eukprot:scaffold10476_cov142-Cylindrotheca_fusiformis.AAC.12